MGAGFLRFLFLSAAVLCSTSAFAAPSQCSSVADIGSGAFGYKNSAPVRACSAHTCPITRFRHDPTLLFKTRNYPSFSCQVLDRQGRLIVTCPRQSAIGFAGGRCRCSSSDERLTERVRRSAVARTGSPEVYFRMGNKCVRVPDAGACYGVQRREFCTGILR